MTARNPGRSGRVTPKKPRPTPPAKVEPPKPPAGKLRILKVLVQPVLVLDDEDGLREVQHATIEVKGADWAEWAKTAYDADALEVLRSQIVATPPAGGGE